MSHHHTPESRSLRTPKAGGLAGCWLILVVGCHWVAIAGVGQMVFYDTHAISWFGVIAVFAAASLMPFLLLVTPSCCIRIAIGGGVSIGSD